MGWSLAVDYLVQLVVDLCPSTTQTFRGAPLISSGMKQTAGIWTDGGISNVRFVVTGNSGPAPIPEPGTLLLIGSGLVGLGAGARRRKKHLEHRKDDESLAAFEKA